MSQSDDLHGLDEVRVDGSEVTLGPADRAILLDREMSGLELGSVCSDELLRSEKDEASSSDGESSSSSSGESQPTSLGDYFEREDPDAAEQENTEAGEPDNTLIAGEPDNTQGEELSLIHI